MVEKIRTALTHLSSAIQAGKIYSTDHPRFKEFVRHAHQVLTEVLKEKKDLTLGIVEEELAWEEEIFFTLSQKLKTLVLYLRQKGVERMVFHQGLEEKELERFLSFLIESKPSPSASLSEALRAAGVNHIRTGKIRAPAPAGEDATPRGEASKQRENTLQGMTSAIEKVLNEDAVDYMELQFHLLSYMEDFIGRRQELVDLVSIKRKDLSTFLHLLNVSTISMYVASKLGFSRKDVLDIGMSGLFHDIGKLSVSRRILGKKSRLEEKEFSRMKHHTVRGAEILTKYAGSIGRLPPVVALEHHLRYDLKGYPRLPFPRPPHMVSQLVSLCDVYDALAQRRSYKKDYPPRKIHAIMMEGRGAAFHPQLLEDFFRIIGVWPVGTIVSLSEGSIAVVRAANEKDIFRPVVEIIHPPEKKGTVDLSARETGLFIQKSLNPFQEGRKYLEALENPR